MLRVLVLCFHDFRETSVVFDETLPTINKSKHPNKGGTTRNKNEGPMSKKNHQNRANHQGTSNS
jgi:hypothetical protein